MTFVIVLEPHHLTNDPAHAISELGKWRNEYPDALLAEVVIPGADPRTAIPGELDRAIDEWNTRIVGKLKFAKQRIRARAPYVQPFRKWKREIGHREYFLWQLIDDLLAATDFTQAWMRFGLFFKKKDGEYHSDLFRAGHYRDPNYTRAHRELEPPQKEWTDQEKRDFVSWARETKAKIGGLSYMSEIHLRNLEKEGY